jgi:hypothetical protein
MLVQRTVERPSIWTSTEIQDVLKEDEAEADDDDEEVEEEEAVTAVWERRGDTFELLTFSSALTTLVLPSIAEFEEPFLGAPLCFDKVVSRSLRLRPVISKRPPSVGTSVVDSICGDEQDTHTRTGLT